MNGERWRSEQLRSCMCWTTVAIAVLMLANGPARADALVFYASESGRQTFDQGEGGGNPFASALVEVLQRPTLTLSELPAELQRLTEQKSRGLQSADAPVSVPRGNVSLVPAKPEERRIALVMVVSDYAQSGGAHSLPGAKYDAERIASALRRAGFDTEIALDFGLRAMRDRLADFGNRTTASDLAVIYTTGHGVEVEGTVYLLPGDYPIKEHATALATRALPLPEMARLLGARRANLVFYGGCRDNPFTQ
jgi:hypothetical protein